MNLQSKHPTPKPQSRRSHVIKSFKAKADAKRTFAEKFADMLTVEFGSIAFLLINGAWFLVWILINTGKTWIEPFDPFPFGLLTTIVSIEAIFLAIIVLISQNREARVAELREELDLQINIISEQEITKVIELLMLSLKKQGVHVEQDPDLQSILGISNEQIEEALKRDLAGKN